MTSRSCYFKVWHYESQNPKTWELFTLNFFNEIVVVKTNKRTCFLSFKCNNYGDPWHKSNKITFTPPKKKLLIPKPKVFFYKKNKTIKVIIIKTEEAVRGVVFSLHGLIIFSGIEPK